MSKITLISTNARLVQQLIAVVQNDPCQLATFPSIKDFLSGGGLYRDGIILVDYSSSESGSPNFKRLLADCRDIFDGSMLAILPRDSKGFELSGLFTDFLIWPCDNREMKLRLSYHQSLRTEIAVTPTIRHQNLAIDPTTWLVTLDGQPVTLTLKEYKLLTYMASRPGAVCSRQTLLKQVWEASTIGNGRTVDVHIRRLRSKIESSSRHFIETVPKVGYRFRAASS